MPDYPRVPNDLLHGNPLQARVHDRLQIFSCRTIRYQLRKTGWLAKEHVFVLPDGSEKVYDAKRFSLQESAEIAGLSKHDTLIDATSEKRIKLF